MKTRAELLAEIEEKRIENSGLRAELKEISLQDPEARGGYDPYDNPGLRKEVRDSAALVSRRRRILQRKR